MPYIFSSGDIKMYAKSSIYTCREKSSMSYNVAYDQDATNELVAESPTSVAGSCNAPAAGMYPDAQKQIKKTRKRGKCSRKKAKKGSRNRKNHEQSSRNNRP